MAEFKVQYLVPKTNKAGETSWFIQPSKTLRNAGWEAYPLGKVDRATAIKAAEDFKARVDASGPGGITPNQIKPPESATLGALIKRYTREILEGTRADGKPHVQPNTAKTYRTGLKRLDIWAGQQPLAYITPQRVEKLRDKSLSSIGHDPTHKLLKMGRTLFKFAIKKRLVTDNPFDNFDLSAPGPRDHLISTPTHDALVDAAQTAGLPSMALAIMLAMAIGQRQGDYLKLIHTKYVPIPRHKMMPHVWDIHCQLAPDGQPMGIRVKQSKTNKWVEVPVVGDVRTAIEVNIARARALGIATILFDDRGGERNGRPTPPAPYSGKAGEKKFQSQFAEVRTAAAIKIATTGDQELAEEIANCKFLDFRRSCITHLGELGLEDHEIAAISGHDINHTRKILETYMPRTTGRAAAAIATVALNAQRDEADQKRKAAQ